MSNDNRFVKVYPAALARLRALDAQSPSALRVLLYLLETCSRYGVTTATIGDIALATEMTAWTANRAISVLKKGRFITRTHSKASPSTILINASIGWKAPSDELWHAQFNDPSVLVIPPSVLSLNPTPGAPTQ